jgi:hypothetical protein
MIIKDRKSVQEARQVYGEAMKAKRQGQPLEIMQWFMFEIPRDQTGELNEAII